MTELLSCDNSPVSIGCLRISRQIHPRSESAVRSALVWAFTHHTVYSVVFLTIVLVILSLAGGAICRIAALQFARGARPGLRQALRFSRRKLASLVAAPIGPLGHGPAAGPAHHPARRPGQHPLCRRAAHGSAASAGPHPGSLHRHRAHRRRGRAKPHVPRHRLRGFGFLRRHQPILQQRVRPALADGLLYPRGRRVRSRLLSVRPVLRVPASVGDLRVPPIGPVRPRNSRRSGRNRASTISWEPPPSHRRYGPCGSGPCSCGSGFSRSSD